MNSERKPSSSKDTPSLDSTNQSNRWIQESYSAISQDGTTQRYEDFCSLQCRIIQHKLAFIYPNKLAEQSPDLLNYLNQFAVQNNLRLIQDRRTDKNPTEEELRKATPPVMALGVGLLLQKTGLTGEHNLQLPVERQVQNIKGEQFKKLLGLGTKVEETGKTVTLYANRFLQENPGPKMVITGHASKITNGDMSRIFSVFNGAQFKAIGYAQRSDFVFHVFAGGGSIDHTHVWGPLANMTREQIHVRLYRDEDREHKFGLFYSTYHLDLQHSTQLSKKA